jgi:hypothetical protein
VADRLDQLRIAKIPQDGRLLLQDFQQNVKETELKIREFTVKFIKMGGEFIVIDFDREGRSKAYRLGHTRNRVTHSSCDLGLVRRTLHWNAKWLRDLRGLACKSDIDKVDFEPAYSSTRSRNYIYISPWNRLMCVIQMLTFPTI